MPLHVFQSLKVPCVTGLTIDSSGANLPVDHAPWERVDDTWPAWQSARVGLSSIASEMVRQGFALISTDHQPKTSGVT